MSKVLRTGHGKAARSPLLASVTVEDARALVKASKDHKTTKCGSFEVELSSPGGAKKKVKFKTVREQVG